MAGRRRTTIRPRPEGFDPLGMAPPAEADRYRKLGDRAHQAPMVAIKAKCLECCAWSYPEAARCEIRTCPLWALNRWIFARGSVEREVECRDW